jgi:hypothetical protein
MFPLSVYLLSGREWCCYTTVDPATRLHHKTVLAHIVLNNSTNVSEIALFTTEKFGTYYFNRMLTLITRSSLLL